MRQFVGLDGFGRGTRLVTTALDRGSVGPTNGPWADEYCQGEYDADYCGRPLFEQNLVRDALGRARSVKSFWGNPETGPIAGRAGPWRGYNYDAEGRLTTVFEQAGVTDPVPADPIGAHSVTNQELINLANSYATSPEPIRTVDWLREPDVGGLQSISEQSGATRWSQSGPGPNGARAVGHQLGSVSLDGSTYAIEHDEQGRVTDGAGATFEYSIRGRLLKADRGGLHEDYLYDADGRLAAIINGKTRFIVYDGKQMIAGMDTPGTTRWEVVAGAFTDQILEYSSEFGDRLVPIADHRNSAVGWWNAETRQLEHIIEYTPHGRVTLVAPDGSVRCQEEGTGRDCVREYGLPQFGFASLYRSERTGITYMRNRWYAPKLGQFLSHDPLGYIDSYNLYGYAAMDPINFWDPFGLGSTGFGDDPLDSSFVQGGFGNNPQCPGCFDTSSSDSTGIIGGVRSGADSVERGAAAVGDTNRQITNDIRGLGLNSFRKNRGLAAVPGGAAFVVADVWGMLTPQSGDDVMFELATLGFGKGLGPLASGARARGIGSHRGDFLEDELTNAGDLFNKSGSGRNCVASVCAAVEAHVNRLDFGETLDAAAFSRVPEGPSYSEALSHIQSEVGVQLADPGGFMKPNENPGMNCTGFVGDSIS